ncbi:MAG: M48 family metalloprotease [Chitinophagales bacterium]
MKINTLVLSVILLFTGSVFQACNKDDDSGGGSWFNVFSIEDDKEIGAQLDAEIRSKPQEYPILNENDHQAAYQYIKDLRDEILISENVAYRNEFEWKVTIINDDVLNAFVAPGGYIYVYTGLIKYLDSKDELAGVLGHEIAHADLRHSTEALTKQTSISLVAEVLLGENQGAITELAQGLLALKFSRSNESEADEFSVVYLCETKYNASGAAGFFEKLDAEGGQRPLEFLSTHPNPDNRVVAINDKETELGCSGDVTISDYDDLKNSLP